MVPWSSRRLDPHSSFVARGKTAYINRPVWSTKSGTTVENEKRKRGCLQVLIVKESKCRGTRPTSRDHAQLPLYSVAYLNAVETRRHWRRKGILETSRSASSRGRFLSPPSLYGITQTKRQERHPDLSRS